MSERKNPKRGRSTAASASQSRQGSGSTTQLSVSQDRIINILIVDDEPKNLTVLETVLDDPSYRLVRAESANQALLSLVTEEFALLILDIRMPGMTGFELAQMVKERKKTADVPIIFLTAYYNDDQHVLEGYGSGAVDYLHKPVNAAILRSKVAVFAELYRKNRECGIANNGLLAEVAERRRAQEQLRELNETLEQRVAERTEELLRASTELNETNARYRSLFDNSLDAIISLDTKGHFVTANPAALRLTGRTLDELKSIHFADLCVSDQREAAMNAFRSAAHNECITMDTAIITAGGERRDLFISGAPAVIDGEFAGISCIARDITDRKRVETELNAAKVMAEKANLAKSEFLSSMSHELRTPLNAILGFAQIMESDLPPPTPSQKQNLSEILKAGWYLLELINEILDLAQIESGKMLMSMEPVLLSDIMHECIAMIEPQTQKRGIRVTHPPTEFPYVLNADRIRLKQALINLLSNAVKYNREGGSVVMDCIVNTPRRIRILIKDTGMGLAPQQLAQLFQPFNRLGQEGGAEEGTGIGLVVTKRLVELMGGAIGVESTLGVGSTFWIELNLSAESQIITAGNAVASPAQIQAGAPLRTLLYIEDNPANLRLVENLIARRSDLRLLCAMDGKEGIDIARASLPDVVLMDINLPGINGIQAMKILRADPATAHIPVIALSANAMPLNIQKSLESGFFCYITKPIKVNEFMEVLDGALKFTQTVSTDMKKDRKNHEGT